MSPSSQALVSFAPNFSHNPRLPSSFVASVHLNSIMASNKLVKSFSSGLFSSILVFHIGQWSCVLSTWTMCRLDNSTTQPSLDFCSAHSSASIHRYDVLCVVIPLVPSLARSLGSRVNSALRLRFFHQKGLSPSARLLVWPGIDVHSSHLLLFAVLHLLAIFLLIIGLSLHSPSSNVESAPFSTFSNLLLEPSSQSVIFSQQTFISRASYLLNFQLISQLTVPTGSPQQYRMLQSVLIKQLPSTTKSPPLSDLFFIDRLGYVPSSQYVTLVPSLRVFSPQFLAQPSPSVISRRERSSQQYYGNQ